MKVLVLLVLSVVAAVTPALVTGAAAITFEDPPPTPAPSIVGNYEITKTDGTPPIPGSVFTTSVFPVPIIGGYLATVYRDGVEVEDERTYITGGPTEFTWVNRRGRSGTLELQSDGTVDSEVDGDETHAKDRLWTPL
jgi:hypothetical protein